MGLNNLSLMSGSTVSGNVSEEMSPAISASNHLMGQQISANRCTDLFLGLTDGTNLLEDKTAK